MQVSMFVSLAVSARLAAERKNNVAPIKYAFKYELFTGYLHDDPE